MEGETDKETSIGFKVRESEKRRWKEIAERSGMSLSSFIRRGVRAISGEDKNDAIARGEVVSMLNDLIRKIASVPPGSSSSPNNSILFPDGLEVEMTDHHAAFVEGESASETVLPIAKLDEPEESLADAFDGAEVSSESRDPVPGIVRLGDLVAFIPFTVTADDKLRDSIRELKDEIKSDPESHGGCRVEYSGDGGQKWVITAPSKEAREAFIKEFFRRGGK